MYTILYNLYKKRNKIMPTYKQWKESPSGYQTEPMGAYNYWKSLELKSNFISFRDKPIRKCKSKHINTHRPL